MTTIPQWLLRTIDSQRKRSTLQRLSLACPRNVSQDGPRSTRMLCDVYSRNAVGRPAAPTERRAVGDRSAGAKHANRSPLRTGGHTSGRDRESHHRNVMTPQLKNGNYDAGVVEGDARPPLIAPRTLRRSTMFGLGNASWPVASSSTHLHRSFQQISLQ
jgi:hypothetical protein